MVAVLTFVSVGAALAQTPAPQLQVKGVITNVNIPAPPPTPPPPPTVTIKQEDASLVILKVDPSTIITKAGLGKAAIDDLAIGDRAVAIYDAVTLVASKITVSKPLAKHHSFVGTIKNGTLTSNSFVLTAKKGDVTIKVNSQTKYKVPGIKDATFADFLVGDRVAVLAVEDNGGNLALHVVLIPGKPTFIHRVGTIEAYNAGANIKLKDKKGELSTFTVTNDTKIVLKKGATGVEVGKRATVVARRDPATDQFTAREIIVFGPK